MDWTLAIERNRSALLRIVAGLLTMAGLAGGGVVDRLPRATRRAIPQILRPAESALRRLIIIVAYALKESIPQERALVKAASTAASQTRPRSPHRRRAERVPPFQLFDTRKRFDFNRVRYCPESRAPRVWSIDADPLVPEFVRPGFIPSTPLPKPDETISARALCRRLAAANGALADLPKQARRLARWRARRILMKEAKFRDPLRPGFPPGYRKKPRHEAGEVLKDCHALAFDLPLPNTS